MSCKYYVDISNGCNANKTYITLLHPDLTEDVRLTSDDARNVAKQLLAAADAADELSKIREEGKKEKPLSQKANSRTVLQIGERGQNVPNRSQMYEILKQRSRELQRLQPE